MDDNAVAVSTDSRCRTPRRDRPSRIHRARDRIFAAVEIAAPRTRDALSRARVPRALHRKSASWNIIRVGSVRERCVERSREGEIRGCRLRRAGGEAAACARSSARCEGRARDRAISAARAWDRLFFCSSGSREVRARAASRGVGGGVDAPPSPRPGGGKSYPLWMKESSRGEMRGGERLTETVSRSRIADTRRT